MSHYPALESLRIGCVQYLNSKPLIYDYPGRVVFDHPARLAEGMAAGMLDAALVPVFEAFAGAPYRLVDGVAIASRGPVYSVFLAYRGELKDVRSVMLDPASLTSVHLLKVLLQEFHGLRPRYLNAQEQPDEDSALLLIGNQAIDFRQHADPETRYLDLGEEWQRQTGLPFVFALWLLRSQVTEPEQVAADFRRLKGAGLARLGEIVRVEEANGHPMAGKYLTEYIRFDLGAPEKRAIALFRDLALRHGFLRAAPVPLDFV